jgi:mono/diheme cytochrome c family protein
MKMLTTKERLQKIFAEPTKIIAEKLYNPECIECHVIGLKYESGFENENSLKELRNVGCEVCHGPRSKHIENVMDNTENKKSEPVAVFKCVSCHTPDHSPGFQTDEAGYRKKNLHKKELKSQ